MDQQARFMFGPLRVSQVARLLGCSETWLRRAEGQGMIPWAKRDWNGWRYYTMDDVEALENILLPPQCDFPDGE